MIVSVVCFMIRVWKASVCPLDVPPFVQFGSGTIVASHVFGTQDGDCQNTLIIYWFYTRLTCVHVEPAHLNPSTAPSLPCETHPRSETFHYTSGEPDARDPAH